MLKRPKVKKREISAIDHLSIVGSESASERSENFRVWKKSHDYYRGWMNDCVGQGHHSPQWIILGPSLKATDGVDGNDSLGMQGKKNRCHGGCGVASRSRPKKSNSRKSQRLKWHHARGRMKSPWLWSQKHQQQLDIRTLRAEVGGAHIVLLGEVYLNTGRI